MFNISSKRKVFIGLGIAVVLLAIPLTYLLTQQSQDLRQRAAEGERRRAVEYCGGQITGCVSQHTQLLRIADTCQNHETTISWGDGQNTAPTILGCINQYTQVVRFPTIQGGTGAQCQPHETTLTWAKGNLSDRQIHTCVSNFTGLARATDRACNSQETSLSWSTNLTCPNGPTPTSIARTTPNISPTSTLTPTSTPQPSTRPTATISPQPTLTSTPTRQPSPSPTLEPSTTPGQNESTLVLQLKMPGIGVLTGDNTTPDNFTRDATVKIFNTQNTVVAETSITVQFDGQIFKGSKNVTLTQGIYYANVKLDNTLFSVTDVFQLTQGSTSTLQLITLVPGDLDQNNILDVRDYNILIACYGDKACTQKELADLNDDDEVSGTDYNILLRSFTIRPGSGATAPQPTTTVTPTLAPTSSPSPTPTTPPNTQD